MWLQLRRLGMGHGQSGESNLELFSPLSQAPCLLSSHIASLTSLDFVRCRCGARNNNLFPYPFLTFNPFEIRVAIYAGATTLALLFFFLLNNIKKKVERVAKGKGRSGAINGAPRGRKP